jgi:exosortase/archaeosortase family protein
VHSSALALRGIGETILAVRSSKGKRRSLSALLGAVLPRNSIRRVAVVFVLILAVLLPFTMFSDGWRGWDTLTRATATVSGAGARAVGLQATVVGSMITLPSRSLRIDPGCTAVTLLAVYVALVLAYPVGNRMRLLAILVGVPVLIAANIARIVAVAVAAEFLTGRAFYMVHDYLFELAMVLVVLMMWVVWLSVARKTA